MLNTTLNRNTLTRSWRAAIVVALLGVAVPIAGAQSSFFTFSGLIVDQTNRELPGASLVLTNTEHQSQYAVRSDSTGRFEFVGLPNGEYALAVTESGFATTKDTVRIVGRDLSRTLELQVGSLQESVTISDRSGTSTAAQTEALQEIHQRAQERNQSARGKCNASSPSPIGGNILPPTKLVDVNPIYPDELKNSKIGGVVIMEALIGTDGTVSDVQVLRSPQPDLENAAVQAVRQWQYSPTLLDCTPIEVRMTVVANFVAQP
jgi:TonB family protein